MLYHGRAASEAAVERTREVDMTEPLRLECKHFIECVRTRRTPLTDGKHGLRVIRVLDAAARSLEQGGVPVRTDSLTPTRSGS